jgi:putative ABC transport system permease protein
MNALLTEIRQATRLLGRDRGFTAAAVVTLAIGVGACTAIFTLVDRVMLRPLPFPDAERLVRVTVDLRERQLFDQGLSVLELQDLAGLTDVFDGASAIFPINANLTGTSEPERVEGQMVSVRYFELLGVPPQLGRLFTAADDAPDVGEIVIISDSLWTRRFGRDPSVIGRTIRLDNDLGTIIGVMPPEFRHPGRGIVGATELWLSSDFRPAPTGPPRHVDGALARLRDGVPMEQAHARLEQLTRDLVREHPDRYPAALGWRLRLIPLQEDLVGDVRPAVTLLMVAVLLVLLIGCANLANLLLVRADARAREMTVRLALGASRARIVRQMLLESAMVAVAGGVAGIFAASWSLDALLSLAPLSLAQAGPIALDGRALAFSLAISLASGVLFGLAPAWRSARTSLGAAGRERVAGDSLTVRRTRDLVVIAQSALALVLLIGSLLVIRSLGSLLAVDPGFESRGVLTAWLWMPFPHNPSESPYYTHAQRMRFFRPLLTRLRALPGVEAAGVTNLLPLAERETPQRLWIEGRPLESVDTVSAQATAASPGYFEAMRIGLVRGRFFTDADDERAPGVMLVSETFANRYFAGEDPIGRRVRPGGRTSTAPWLTIVGIVRDVRSDGLDQATIPQTYRAWNQGSWLQSRLVLRGQFDATTLGPTVAAEIHALDPDLPIYGIRTLDDVVATSLGARRLAVQLLSLFAGIAVLLSAIGTYSVMSYLVSMRQQELGVRLAVGATPRDIGRLVLGRGVALAGAGILLGLIGAVALSGLIQGLLYQHSAVDAATYAAAATLLGVVALLACWIPARRAAAIDPMRTLRAE